MPSIILRSTFEQQLDHLNKTIFENKLTAKVCAEFTKMVFDKNLTMPLVELSFRFRDISITQEKKVYLNLRRIYQLIYSPNSDKLCEQLENARYESTKKSLRQQLFVEFQQSVKKAKKSDNPSLLEQLIAIRGEKLRILFEGTNLEEQLAICASWKMPLLSTQEALNKLCEANPSFLHDPFDYKKKLQQGQNEARKRGNPSEPLDFECRRDFDASKVFFNGIPVLHLLAQEIAYTRQNFISYTSPEELSDRKVWNSLSVSKIEPNIQYFPSIESNDFDRTTFSLDGCATEKLKPFIEKYLFTDTSPTIQEELYKLFVAHFHQSGIAASYLAIEYHHFSGYKFGTAADFDNFEKYSCNAQSDGYSLAAICNVKSKDKQTTFATMKGDFLLTLQDLTNPNFENYSVKLTRITLEIHQIDRKTITDPIISALLNSLEQYQWYLNALVFANNLKENPDDTSAQTLNRVKEDFLTLKDNPYIGNHLYTWIPDIEHIIAKAISDYVTRPASFNLVHSLFDPLSEREKACKPKKTRFQFSTDPAQSNILAFWRQVETCKLAFTSERIITSWPQR